MIDSGRPRRPISTAGAVARFVAAGLVAATAIGLGAYWVVSRNAVAEAIRNAQEIAAIDGRNVVAPALSDQVVGGEPAALTAFDQLVRDRVLSSRVVRVKIWTPEGRIIYSDVPALIGQDFALGAEELEAIRRNRIAAEVSQLSRPENRFERAYGRLLEVYLPISSLAGGTYLFETYQVYTSIDQDQQRIWSAFFPVIIGGLILLLAVQVPLAWSLARGLNRARQEREQLLRRSLEISGTERRRIAHDLHDGVVQALAGAGYSLGAASSKASREGRADLARTFDEAAGVVRQSVRDLRTLIVDIAPPDLAGDRLESALSDLLEPLAGQGLQTHLQVSGLRNVDRTTAAVLYRVAQEAIRNAAAHAAARRVDVTVDAADGNADLEVRDDGRGLSAEEVISRRRDGHVGISMLRSLVEDSGGRLSLASSPGAGTSIRVRMPESRDQ